MSAAWIVVADTSRARIFSAEKSASKLVEIQTLAHPASRLHTGDLISDKPGRDKSNTAGSHNLGNGQEAKQEEAVKFATEICETLECGRTNHRFNKLYVIAAPGFLGTLRKHQSHALQQMVANEVSKNLATHDINDIRKNLPDFL